MSDIISLENEALIAGEYLQAAICRVARGEHVDSRDALTSEEERYVRGLSRQDAIAECERVIRDARAQS